LRKKKFIFDRGPGQFSRKQPDSGRFCENNNISLSSPPAEQSLPMNFRCQNSKRTQVNKLRCYIFTH
jgi:hypothetical protein